MKYRNYRQVTNAFGEGSPQPNLPFPDGSLTAAEIIAYCPHWLKSIDVIVRFVRNGGRSTPIAGMVNEFRHQPGGDTIFVSNSACTMMQYAMRRAGFDNWTVGSHLEWTRDSEGEWDEANLNVSNFRTPNITHPKGKPNSKINKEIDPIEFRDLARHVKQHPSGADALDLTRCVRYAVDHPHESWSFPTDFKRLVKKLGGPREVVPAHYDRQVFARHSHHSYTFSLLPRKTQYSQIGPRSGKQMARTRRLESLDSRSITPQKRLRENDEVGLLTAVSKRRSRRLATKAIVNLRDDDTDNDTTTEDDGTQQRNANKRRKVSDTHSADGDFLQPDRESTSSDTSVADNVSDELFTPIPSRPARRAAEKARNSIKTFAALQRSNFPIQPSVARKPVDPELMKAAQAFSNRATTCLKPPLLSRDRLVIDERSIHLYAEPSATDLWASALSSTRFQGPRRHPPFRELYRLTNPDPWDISDWAENIRWAKEQEKLFGSKTWTEYDYHLECITEHRREIMWVSEEAIRGGL